MSTKPNPLDLLAKASQCIAMARTLSGFTAKNHAELNQAERSLARVQQRILAEKQPPVKHQPHPTQVQLMHTERALILREKQMELAAIATKWTAPQRTISAMSDAIDALTLEINRIHQLQKIPRKEAS
ncbi:MAG: hypothetical protein Q4D85_11300 [Corynebacterium sp.]|uniref:hypothetical protein n=1 Tax=Corynebacterium sp. TaxID=1720 RepID=UPI0026DC8109|nr:hypothetical protein [Corynebacterium sp.]MDO5099321.1 hypothetical protein [Corynebacterium sp.]